MTARAPGQSLEDDVQYRGLTKQGILVFGDAVFSTTPRLYEMTPEEAETIRSLCGHRLTLESLEIRACAGEAKDHAHKENARGLAQRDAQNDSSRDGLTW